ncbi:DUF4062 domain-containing protein [Nostoc commune]|uniref:DUF4062 domain-containing protein n=1 Tax=Nostoc commune TaxID=1178 RepID=UPI0018C716DB
MVNQLIYNVLNVFTASPGDLEDEKNIVREVADRINKALGSIIGWHIEVLSSKEVLPGAGRPQDKINKDVLNKCDIFIGLLWKRWGSRTGKYSSGFEEEFEYVRQIRAIKASPEIWLCFKEVAPDLVADAGPHLKKVLGFKKNQINSKEVFFKEFSDTEEWKDKVYDWLLKYVLRLHQQIQNNNQIAPTEETALPQANETLSVPALPQTAEHEKSVSAQFTELINSVTQAINTNTFDVGQRESKALDDFSIGRLCLLAKAWMSKRYPSELLTVHEINLLYQHKEQLETTPQEWILLFRTIIHDSYEIRPGWYWFQNINIEELLFYLGVINSETEVRRRAFKILESAQICLTKDNSKRSELRKLILTDESAVVRQAGLTYLGNTGTMEDLRITESALCDEDSSVRSEAAFARLLIIARHDPNRALLDIIDNQTTFSPQIFSEIEKQSNNLEKDVILKGIQHHNSQIRVFAIKHLAKLDILSENQLFDLLKDESIDVKKICYQTLANKGIEINLLEFNEVFKNSKGLLSGDLNIIEKITVAVYRGLTPEKLLQQIDWLSNNSTIAYQVLAQEHFPMFSEVVRSDLENNFEELKQKSIEKMYGKYEKDYVDGFLVGLNNTEIDEFVKNKFIVAALSGLAMHGNTDDIYWGRRYILESKTLPDVRLEAVKIIERLGDNSDTNTLISVIKDSYGELQELAARASLKLSPGIDGAASALLETGDRILVKLAIEALMNEDKLKVSKLLEPMLNNENQFLRVQVLVYFIRNCSTDELEQILSRYIKKPQYFYNVIYWLDRILYAPSPIKEMFKLEWL